MWIEHAYRGKLEIHNLYKVFVNQDKVYESYSKITKKSLKGCKLGYNKDYFGYYNFGDHLLYGEENRIKSRR